MRRTCSTAAADCGAVTASGSVTIFLGLSLMLILSLLLTLAEGVHYIGLQSDTRICSRTGVENIMAEYDRPLWEEYGILGLDIGYGSEEMNAPELERRMLERTTYNASQNLYALEVTGCALSSVRLLTDDGCAGFIRESAEAEKKQLGEDAAGYLTGLYSENGSQTDGADADVESMLETSDEALKLSRTDRTTEEGDGGSIEALSVPDEITVSDPPEVAEQAPSDNPIDRVIALRRKTVLRQVIPEETQVAAGSLDSFTKMEDRDLSRGSMPDDLDIRESEKILMRLYMRDHFRYYGDDGERSERQEGAQEPLAYELEYIIAGKESDLANLESVVVRLLAYREGENLIAVMSDSSKMTELEGMAWAIAGITANPLVVRAVKAGLAAAWAYLESVLDVRLLLAGGRVPVVKTPAQWTSRIARIGEYLDAHITAKDGGSGLDYRMYLMQLMMMSAPKKLALRAMDLMEITIRQKEGYANVRMNHMVCELRAHFDYEAAPLLLRWMTVEDLTEDGYSWGRDEDVSYL